MPTAAKLVAGLALALLGFVVSEMIKPLLPDTTDFGVFSLVNAGIGLVVGWIVVGSRAGRGMSAAVSNGLTGTVALVFWGLLVQAVYTMVDRAFRRFYSSMLEAVADTFELVVEYSAVFLDPGLLLVLLVGSLAVGYAAEIAARRWL